MLVIVQANDTNARYPEHKSHKRKFIILIIKNGGMNCHIFIDIICNDIVSIVYLSEFTKFFMLPFFKLYAIVSFYTEM